MGAAEAVWGVNVALPQIKNVMANSIKNEQLVVTMYFLKKLLLGQKVDKQKYRLFAEVDTSIVLLQGRTQDRTFNITNSDEVSD